MEKTIKLSLKKILKRFNRLNSIMLKGLYKTNWGKF